jgi:transketolase
MAKKERIPEHLKPWIEARRRFRLSHMHIQMARELGMNPKKLGKLANHRQEPWKAPLPIFIEDIYFKRFGKEKPDKVRTIKEVAAAQLAKKAAKKLAKQARKAERMAARADGSSEKLNAVGEHAPDLMQASDTLVFPRPS